MPSHHIYNFKVYAKLVRELCDMVAETEYKKVRIGDIIKFCAPRIERREERFLQLKKLSEARPIWNFKELSERVGISRQTLYNWKNQYNRIIASHVIAELNDCGYDAQLLVPEISDIPLAERCRRVNAVCDELGATNVILVSIHVNATGSDGKWHSASGWSAYTTPCITRADTYWHTTCMKQRRNIWSARRFACSTDQRNRILKAICTC